MRRISSSLENRQSALQENRYLSGLDEDILLYLSENTQLIAYEAEESIVREGQSCP